MTDTNSVTTDEPNRVITSEMQDRINQGHLDYRKNIGWYNPQSYDPEQSRRVHIASRY